MVTAPSRARRAAQRPGRGKAAGWQAPGTLSVADSADGNSALSLAVNQATNSIYTANIADGEHPGTVSVINGATCNGTNHAGCSQTPAMVAVGNYPAAITVDPATDTAYVANSDNTISVIHG